MKSTMTPADRRRLYKMAVAVLKENDLGESTKPAPRLYPHQWLWDSCFIAIGLRHLDPVRAQKEILSLFRGQWDNGMLPNVLFSEGVEYHAGPDIWGSSLIPGGSPENVQTSGVTQPPMVAEATVRVGECLSGNERKKFYTQVLPGLIKYHEWLYNERDPDGSGLVALIHPWEAGNEDIPPWSSKMPKAAPLKVKALRRLKQENYLVKRRPDLKHAPLEARPTTNDYYAFYHLARRIRKKQYAFLRIRQTRGIPLLQDVFFNAILIRANHHLRDIAAYAETALPADLLERMDKAPAAFEELYADEQYWSRDFRNGQLVKEPSISSLAGLYAGTIPRGHADRLVERLTSKEYWPKYGIASTPTNSPYFRPLGFWQGPVWINTNWILADGLERYGHTNIAEKLRLQTLALVGQSGGMHEYFSPLDGTPAGTDSFSWTAALVIDMLQD